MDLTKDGRARGGVRRRVVEAVAATALATALAGCGHSPSSSPTTSDAAPSGQRGTYQLTASLANAQVVPKPKTRQRGSGSFAGTIEISGGSGTIDWHLTYKGLDGRATNAQIFLGRPRTKGLAAVDLCAPCAPKAHGSLAANESLLDALVTKPTYVDVQTKTNPHGEIRGPVTVKPKS